MSHSQHISSLSKTTHRVIDGMVIGLLLFGAWGAVQTLGWGIGTWGNTNQISWGLAITNFVWWIGLGHAGTLISAILLIFNQSWRKSVSRIAELMTIFSLICAASFPLIHLGRPWLLQWFIPFTGRLGGLGINFYSPLIWDFFAIGTYFLVSFIFLYLGVLPDSYLIKNHDGMRSKTVQILSLNWIGSRKQWQLHYSTTRLMAGLVTALVISVHSIVSLDFSVTQVRGWHNTLFPPYFVLGAIFSGLAMVQVILYLFSSNASVRTIYSAGLRAKLNRLIRISSIGMAIFYLLEIYWIYRTGDETDQLLMSYKIFGHGSAAIFTGIMVFNILLPLMLWFKKAEESRLISLVVAIGVLIGMWLERYWIVIQTMEWDQQTQTSFAFSPSWVDWSLLAGTVGVFVFLYRLIKRYLPLIPQYEETEQP